MGFPSKFLTKTPLAAVFFVRFPRGTADKIAENGFEIIFAVAIVSIVVLLFSQPKK